MRLTWHDAGLSMTPAAERILRNRQLTCDAPPRRRTRDCQNAVVRDASEAVGQGASLPIEIDPELLAMLQQLLTKGLITEDGVAKALWKLMTTSDDGSVQTGEQPQPQEQTLVSNRSGEAPHMPTEDVMRRHWMAQDRQTRSLLADIQKRNRKFWKVH